MYPTTPPVADLTRVRLRQLAAWIRDELDPVVARDGPETLLADDVLTLHENFHALRVSNITVLDLRVTGIHRAVIEVAGTATRWPGGLADDCERVIQVWRRKFGPLENLRPCLHGSTGRLEGIASVTEFSKASLLERWQRTCPERVAPKRSHLNGDLGFSAGAWWLNPLFAHHAGIIDLDSTEGGVCFDRHGAYAVLLKDGEVEASSKANITYRCSQSDKGRFRLTSAVPRSRLPIRILRSHTLNSIWGPRAGVRYEGLYRVSGWNIRPVERNDFRNNIGDVVYEVNFERVDRTSMEEVIKHPTTFELDDYTEYKRLRRVYRGGPYELVATPPITSLVAPTSQLRALSWTKAPPSPLRSVTFKYPLITVQAPPGLYRLSSTIPEAESFFDHPSRSTLEVPIIAMRSDTSIHHTINDSQKSGRLDDSNSSSMRTTNSNRNFGDIEEKSPWIDFDPGSTASANDFLVVPRAHIQYESLRGPSRESSAPNSPTTSKECSPHSGSRSSPSPSPSPRKSSSSIIPVERHRGSQSQGGNSWEHKIPSPTRKKDQDVARKDIHRSIMGSLTRRKNLLAEILDGTDEDYFSYKSTCTASLSPKSSASIAKRRYARTSSNAVVQPLSPIPTRPMSPTSPHIMRRRNAICLSYGFEYVPASASSDKLILPRSVSRSSSDAFTESPGLVASGSPKSKTMRSLPVSLQDLVSKPKTATPVCVFPAFVGPECQRGEARRAGIEEDTLDATYQFGIMFRDPFKDDGWGNTSWEQSDMKRCMCEGVEGLAPDAQP